MTPAQKRLLVPLRAPRWPRAPWPINILTAAVDGYFEAFFAALIPPGNPPSPCPLPEGEGSASPRPLAGEGPVVRAP